MTENKENYVPNSAKPKKIKATVKVTASKKLEEEIANELALKDGEPEVSNANPAGND